MSKILTREGIENGTVKKVYAARVYGRFPQNTGAIEYNNIIQNLGETKTKYATKTLPPGVYNETGSPGSIIVSYPLRCANHKQGEWECSLDGKPSLSRFKFIKYDESSDTTYLHGEPLTGRTHQVQNHTATPTPISFYPSQTQKKLSLYSGFSSFCINLFHNKLLYKMFELNYS